MRVQPPTLSTTPPSPSQSPTNVRCGCCCFEKKFNEPLGIIFTKTLYLENMVYCQIRNPRNVIEAVDAGSDSRSVGI